jgi:glucose-1-phosphate thymidylyltransferase
MRGIILAGGKGSRLAPLTDKIQKVLLPAGGKPLITYSIETLRRAEITDIAFVLGPKSPGEIIQLLKDGSEWGCRFTYLFKEGGVAAAIGAAEDFARGENVCVLTGDNIIADDIKKWTDAFQGGAFVSHKTVQDSSQLTSLVFDGKQVVELIDSRVKPEHKGKWTPLAYAGVLLLDASAFEKIRSLQPSARGEIEIFDLLEWYAKNKQLYSEPLEKEWIDAGTLETYQQADLLAQKLSQAK